MPQPRRFYFDGEHGQVHARHAVPSASRVGLPVYCLHQSPKSSLEFEGFMARASDAPHSRELVAVDYPGYGMSDAPPSEHDASIELYARTAWAAADALGHDRIDLFGNHTGSKVATEMALQQPSRVRSIAMVSAAILTDEERRMFESMFTPIPLDEELTRISTTWKRILSRRKPGVTLEWMDRSLYQTLMGGENYEWGHVAAFGYAEPFTRALAELPHRKILLNPGDDLQVCTRRADAIMTNGEIIELPDWSYGFLDFEADAVAGMIFPRMDKG